MADILITGGTGLLGASLLPSLIDAHDVVAIARRPPEEPGVRWVSHDLRQPALPLDMPRRIDVVIHLAQSREFRRFPSGAIDTHAINVGSTALLLDWARSAGAQQFIVASTGGVYGNASTPHREDEPIRLPDVTTYYVASKLASEALSRSYHSHFAIVTLRPFFMYGRAQDRSMLLPRVVERLRSGRSIPIAGDDGIRFNPIHVSDASRAVVAALTLREGAVINLAGPQIISLRHAVEILAARLGVEAKFEREPNSEPNEITGDISRLCSLLDSPRVKLAEVADELCKPPHGQVALETVD